MSYPTEQACGGWIKRYIIFQQMRHPREMWRVEIESYLSSEFTASILACCAAR